ncbi:hypothetical protein WH47_03177 [Habropoda laboriosa]|uniref:Uncharacterized protein n=1 Tax=Habropoda laboriosa TaxID=597456 RepID=A0A0L7RAX6_9HYME|nr:hypothetical protein WH47_03177 [Habropoda laboriosa]
MRLPIYAFTPQHISTKTVFLYGHRYVRLNRSSANIRKVALCTINVLCSPTLEFLSKSISPS